MSDRSPFLTRVELKDYKSIAKCDVRLGPLTFLVGANGAGKSNFLDALRLVSDGLRTTLDHAFRERGGLQEVRRRSSGHPRHFAVAVEFDLGDGRSGRYAFKVGAKRAGFELSEEICHLGEAHYHVRAGRLLTSSAPVTPRSRATGCTWSRRLACPSSDRCSTPCRTCSSTIWTRPS